LEKVKSRSAIFFVFSLKIFLTVFTVLLLLRTIQQDYETSIALLVALSLFLILYRLYVKSYNVHSLAFVLNLGMFVIVVGYAYLKGCEDFSIIWLLMIPVLGYTLMSLRGAFLFSLAGIFGLYILFYIYSDLFVYDEKFRLTVFYILLTVIMHFFAYKLDYTISLLHDYNENLESKVDELLKSEQERERLFIQTSKLASLGQLLSSIAHQWKQPIATISAIDMNLKVKEELSGSPDNERLKLIGEIDEQIQFMTETMNDFRSFFKADDNKAVPFDINEETKKLIYLFDKDFKSHNININIVENTKEILVHGYPSMYKQALLNLISNARDAIESNKAENKNINVLLSRVDGYGLVLIEDHAGGIPENLLKSIFDKYFTTKGEKGSGIGLVMTKEIIEDFCQGKLTVENTHDGARFTVYIPVQ